MKNNWMRLSLLALVLISSCGVVNSSTSSSGSTSSQFSSFSLSTDTQSQNKTSSEIELSAPETTNTLLTSPEPASTSSSIVTSSQPEAPASVQTPYSEKALSLFDRSSSLAVKITMSDDVAKTINQVQTTPWGSKYGDFYFPADVTITLNGETTSFPSCGIRLKGNTSRTSFYDGHSITNFVHFKVNFGATFDSEEYTNDSILHPYQKTYATKEERKKAKDRNLYGFSKLDFKYIPRNGGNQNGFLREAYSMDVFQEEGIITSLTSFCDFTFGTNSSKKSGKYEVIEPIDKDFLKHHFSKEEAKGDLYKCSVSNHSFKGASASPYYRADLHRNQAVEKTYDEKGYANGERIKKGEIGVEDDYNDYFPVYDLKTNDNGEESDFSHMSDYINAIWNVTNKGADHSLLESVLDVDEFLKFSAVSYVLGNLDDQRYNGNNYYLYFRPSDGKAIYIPYDWDWALGLVPTSNPNYGKFLWTSLPFDTQVTEDNYSHQNNLYYCTIYDGNYPVGNPSPISYSKEDYQETYLSYIDDVIDDGALDSKNYQSLITTTHIGQSEFNDVKNYMASKKSVYQRFKKEREG